MIQTSPTGSFARFVRAVVLFGTACCVGLLFGAPVNDNFASAALISGSNVVIDTSNYGASKETGEPNHAGDAGGRSVWWKWVAPSSGQVGLTTMGSNFDTLLAVYTGTAVNALTGVASDDESGGRNTSLLTFAATAGTTYWIAVDGYFGDYGAIHLTLNFPLARPANDNFANAALISGANAQIDATNVYATKETGEPDHGWDSGGHSVWWKWVAPSSGMVEVNTMGSNFDTLLAVYTGSAVGALTLIAGDDESGVANTSALAFPAVAGTTYWIAVDGYYYDVGTIKLNLISPAVPPANDQFANATPIGGKHVHVIGRSIAASKETAEPNHGGTIGGRSVWWKWVAPVNGRTSVDTYGSTFDTVLAVYTGSAVNALTLVAQNDDSPYDSTSAVSFNATAGTTYWIAVDGYYFSSYGPDAGLVRLTLASPTDPPANDTFANAILITGSSATVTGSNVYATKQPLEPAHAGDYGGGSVWWKWVAPAGGLTALTTVGSSFDTLLAVYTGASVDALTLVAADDQSGGYNTSALAFNATAGTTYWIAVDGYYGDWGSILLSLTSPVSPPANDFFANAALITGSSAHLDGTNQFATSETGEPAHDYYTAQRSVWWKWVAPSTGLVGIDTVGSNFDTILAVYTGSAVNALTVVAADDEAGGSHTSALAFNATSGTTYWIAVDGYYGATGAIRLNLALPLPAPANDAFANATLISGSVAHILATNLAATKETGEPNHAGSFGGHSVWWKWVAPANGTVAVDTIGSYVDTVLGVYTGTTVNALTTIASDDDSGGYYTSALRFSAVAGTTYMIGVDGYGGETGPIRLNLVFPADAPANDAFASAALISGSTAQVMGTNLFATNEPGEPIHTGYPGGHSVWWKWVASGNGVVALNTLGSTFDTQLAVYTGSAVNGLSLVAGNDDFFDLFISGLAFNATSGTTYYIAVDGYGGRAGNILLNLGFAAAAPANDQFANAALITGSSAHLDGSNVMASAQAGEPVHAGFTGGHSVWWKWVAPSSGIATVDTIGSGFDTLLGVYTGTAVDNLVPIAQDDESGGGGTSALAFNATSGATYFIAVDGYRGMMGAVHLNLSFPATAPANDNFANAIAMSGTQAHVSGSSVGATKETGEPDHAGNGGGHSVWWKWVAPARGVVELRTFGTMLDTLLAVYTGTAVNGLTLVAQNDDFAGPGSNASVLAFAPTSGTTYWIAVDGYAGASGKIELDLSYPLGVPAGGNNAPTISDIADQSIAVGGTTGALAFTVGDAETAAASLTVSGSSSNTTLVPNANIVFGGSGASRTVTVAPASGQSGSAVITVTVSDGALTASDTFTLTVAGSNTAPTISDIADQAVNEDTPTGALAFTVGDAQTAAGSLTVSGSSSNITLVPNSAITFGGSGANRTVTVTPAANQSGTATITVTVSDGSLSASDTFVLTVNAVNDVPTISSISNQFIAPGGNTGALAFTVGDAETAAGSLVVSGTSSNTTLVPNANIVFGGSGANRTVTVTPTAAQTGTANITLTVNDGVATATSNFTLTVSSGANITLQPISQIVVTGSSATFTVTANGAGTLSYLWYYTPVGSSTPQAMSDVTGRFSGTHTATLTISNVVLTDAGDYVCVVTDNSGPTTSTAAQLSVFDRLVKIVSQTGTPGATVVVPVQLIAHGNENALGFSVNFDATQLTYVSAAAGAQATDATLNTNSTQAASGKLGFALAKPSGAVWSAGAQELVKITFTIGSGVANATILPLTFGDTPVFREISSATAEALAGGYVTGNVTAFSGYEADMNGNGAVTITDWVKVGRIVAGLDPVPTGVDFMKADCAPRSSFGNGALSITDWVQAGRYAAGLDPLTVVGGPAAP